MMIDTGIYCDFALTKAGRSKIGDYFRVVNRDAKVAAFNGVATVELGYISQINIVGSGIEDAKNEYLCGYSATATTECAYFDKLTNQVVRVPFDGFIGNNFLKKLSAVINYDQDKMYLIPLTAKKMPRVHSVTPTNRYKSKAFQGYRIDSKLAGEWRLNTATGIVAVKPELLISGDSSISIDLSSGRIEGKIKLVRDHNYDAIFIGEEKTTAGGFYRRTSLNDLELLLMQGTFEEIQEAFRSMSPQIFNAKDKGKFTHYKFKKVAAHAKK